VYAQKRCNLPRESIKVTGNMDPAPRQISNDVDLTRQSLGGRSTTDATEFWRNPLAYRQVAVGIQHVEGQRLLALHAFDPRTLIIDLGTGDGSLLFDHLLPLVPQGKVIGVDKSQAMLEGATRYVDGKPGAERVSFLLGDVVEANGQWIETLKGLVKDADCPVVAFSSAMLHHIHNPAQFRLALRNIRGLLQEVPTTQPTRFLASFAGEGNFDLLISCCDEVRSQPEWRHFFADWRGYPLLRPSAERATLELLEAGFDLTDASVELVRLEMLLDSDEKLFRFVRNCMRSFMNHLQQALQSHGVSERIEQAFLEQFARKVADRYLAQCGRGPAGEVVFPVDNIELSISPAADFRVADFANGKVTGDARELASIEFLERVSQLPAVQEYKPIVREMLAVQPGHVVLDAGCGTGVDGLWLLEELKGEGTLLAFDSNPVRVRHTAERFSGKQNVEVREQDLSALDLADNCLDRIYCERVLIHAADPVKILCELARVLKPGGRIVLVEPDFTRMSYASNSPSITSQIVAARASEIANPDIGCRLSDLAAHAGLQAEQSFCRQLEHSYEAARLLDLHDIENHSGKGIYPGDDDVQMWLLEQAKRAEDGTFHATTPMHIVAFTKGA
jgi:ubiquinone/menaquinone biosynthesis C-methylase UbiE